VNAILKRRPSSPLPPVIRAGIDDRKWFSANPDRQFRIRPMIPGELGEIEGDAVASHWPAPGRSFRVAFTLARPLPDEDLDEETCKAVFEEVLEMEPERRRIFRAHGYGCAGHA
jgi:hypothetical protein